MTELVARTCSRCSMSIRRCRQSADGLIHQGWRDADDAVFHADGSPAEGSIALCEVQGYVYGALRAAATLATALSRTAQAARFTRIAWFAVVLPVLLLNYFGQGALLIANPAAAENPFYLLVPSWRLYAMVLLATLATVIASQALISGAFSITMQALQLGFLPRLQILHTSSKEFWQIYIPAVNWVMMAVCIIIVLGFRTSSNLAAAYGIAVTSTMRSRRSSFTSWRSNAGAGADWRRARWPVRSLLWT